MTDRRDERGPESAVERRSDAPTEPDELEQLLDAVCHGACIPDRTAAIGRIAGFLARPGTPEHLRRRAMDAMGKLARRFDHEPACVSGLSVMKTRIVR